MAVQKDSFVKNSVENEIDLFTLTNDNGVRASVMTHGAAIVSLETPDRTGQVADIVLGHDSAAGYVPATPFYLGAVVGRFANRIKNGTFTLDGREYTLEKNNGSNALHGGRCCFADVIWSAEPLPEKNAVRMIYISSDGEEGFPGEVRTAVTYTLTADNELKIDYTAETSAPTPCNITNHSYFNLAGHDAGCCDAQLIMINADTFLPTDEAAIPYGHELPVQDTPFDFRTPHPIGERIDADHEQIRFGNGYDHNFCLNKKRPGELSLAACAEDPASGRVMETWTTEPGVQFYSGNFLDGTCRGKGGYAYPRRGGFCLETQHWPDSPNQPQFPDTILRPGRPFKSQTIYRFSVR